MNYTIHAAWASRIDGERRYTRKTTPDTFGAMLKRLREGYGMKKAELARCAGCDSSMIVRLEDGTRPVTRAMLIKLADGLEVTPEEYDAMLTAAGYRVPEARIDPVLRMGEAKVLARFWQGADASEREEERAA